MKISLITLLGLGGIELSEENAIDSAKIANRINPRFLSALTLMFIPNTEIYQDHKLGKFHLPDAMGMLKELRLLVQGLNADRCIFRANHASNYFALAGTLSKDKQRLLDELDFAISNRIIRPDFLRAL